MIDFCKFKLFISLVNYLTTKDFTISSSSQKVLLTIELLKLEWQHKIYMKFSCYKKTAVFLNILKGY